VTTPRGIDATNGRFGEVSVEKCIHCGTSWLRYFVEYEAFTASGRWFRGLMSEKAVALVSPELAVSVLESMPWHFRGGSYFGSTGEVASGPIRADL
jgi:hypothetical protein